MPKSFILTDIDHTLLSASGELHERNLAALRQAVAEGSTVVLATARSFPGALPVHRALGLTTPLIVSSGTLVCAPDGTILRSVSIAAEIVAEVFPLFRESGQHWSLRAGKVAYLHADFDRGRPPYDDERYYRVGFPTSFKGVVAMNLFGFGVRAFYERHDWERWELSSAYYAPNAFDRRESMTLASAATSKGAAAGWLRAHLGLTHLPILAIGDSPADISMFPLGIGVAPANSLIKVQRAADWIAPHCDDCAVAAALERFVFADSSSGEDHEPSR